MESSWKNIVTDLSFESACNCAREIIRKLQLNAITSAHRVHVNGSTSDDFPRAEFLREAADNAIALCHDEPASSSYDKKVEAVSADIFLKKLHFYIHIEKSCLLIKAS